MLMHGPARRFIDGLRTLLRSNAVCAVSARSASETTFGRQCLSQPSTGQSGNAYNVRSDA